MELRHRVSLNDNQLDELDERILVLGVNDGAGRETLNAVSRFGGIGQRVTTRHRDTLDIVVSFGLRIKAGDMAARSELFEKVSAWAMGGGWLKVNYKPDRRIYVTCAQLPGAGDLADWTTEFNVTFRAYGVPYWQQETPAQININSTRSATRQMEVPGTASTVMNLTFRNLSGMEIASFTITTGKSRFTLDNLGLMADETLAVEHTVDGLVRIGIYSTAGAWRSVLGRRTADSSDDLTVNPGTMQWSMSAQRAGRLIISCYGRYA
jgi:hypothetical protein